MDMPTSLDTAFIPYIVGQDSSFDKSLPFVLGEEGGYSNDAHDPGGMTMWGIIQREYDRKRRQWGLPTQWVKNISRDEMRTIYYTDYWMPHCPALHPGLALEFFDLDVNGGPHRAVMTLQRVLGLYPDGVWGPKTDAAVAAITDQAKVVRAFMDERERFYHSLSTFKFFGKGWIRRSQEIETDAEKLDNE